MPGDPLDPAVLTNRLPTLLPVNKLASAQDGLAALLHTAMAELDFRLIAIDEKSPTTQDLNNILPQDWAKNGPGNYTFRYKHQQSSMEFLLKVSKLGVRTLFNAIALQDDKTASLDISTNDFTSLSFFPHEIGAVGAEPLVHGFVSSAKIMDLMSQFKSKIVERIMPGLHKDGYAEQSEPPSTDQRPPEEQPPRYSPRHVNPPAENPPYTQDRPGPYPYNRNTLFEVGRRDLDPIPLNPFSPPSLFPPGSGRGDGMLVGPDHPMFSGLRPRGPPGAWGGDGFLPPMGAPPRARFDPVGPGPFPGGGGGPRLPGRGNMHGPDNDEFLPPGSHGMYM